MNLHILDTDILSLYQQGHGQVLAHVATLPPTELATTVITVQEQLDGWRGQLPRARKREQLALLYQV